MKTLNRFIFLFLFSFIAIGLFSDLTVSAQNTTSKPSTVISEEDSSVYSGDVIVWKYKTMNGKELNVNDGNTYIQIAPLNSATIS